MMAVALDAPLAKVLLLYVVNSASCLNEDEAASLANRVSDMQRGLNEQLQVRSRSVLQDGSLVDSCLRL
jgi:hypothetical protein